MIRSTWRGHTIIKVGDLWEYEDKGKLVIEAPMRTCGQCLRPQLGNDYDPCLGWLPGVLNACCGHGKRDDSYIQFANGLRIEGFVISQEVQQKS